MQAHRRSRSRRDELSGLLPEKIGRYTFFDIARHANMDSRAVTERLWSLAWQGRVTNDAFATVRKGILTDFAPFSYEAGTGQAFTIGLQPLDGKPSSVRKLVYDR